MTSAARSDFFEALGAVYGFMSPLRRRQFLGVGGLMVVGALAEIAAIGSVVPFLSLLSGAADAEQLGWVTDSLARFGARTGAELVLATAVLFMVLALVAGTVRLLVVWASQRFIFGLGHDLAAEVQRRILFQPYSFHLQHNSSQALAALDKVDILVTAVLLQLMYAAASATVVLFIMAALLRIDALTALLTAASFGALYLLVSRVTARSLEQNSTAAAGAYEGRLRIVQESLGGIRDVLIDHSQDAYVDAFRKVDRRLAQARTSTALIGAAPRIVIEAVALVAIALVAIFLWQREGGLVPALPVLGAMGVGTMRLLPAVQQLYFSWTVVAGNRRITSDVVELLELPMDGEGGERGAPLPFSDAIRFEEVSFAYPGAPGPALHDISISIPCGARVAVVGRSGSGKSTFADLLMGLLQPDEGRILVDAMPLAGETRSAWARSIAHVPQAIFLADTSIARNIAFGVPDEAIDMERVARAAAVAQLDEWLATLPDGLATRIGERGVRLSGGQRQRLGIARALYKDVLVLVLDEATNALDPETEGALLRSVIEDSGKRRTILLISHRESSIASCDLVMRLDHGRLVDLRPGGSGDAGARARA